MPELSPALSPYDAVVLVSFGGPEGPDDVLPFLRRVTAGKGIPDERLAEVGEHYALFGGVSPINAQNRSLMAAIEAELAIRGMPTRLAWGNRNFHPLLADTFSELAQDGHRRLLVLTTSAYSCYSSCRQYRENLADAVSAAEEATGVTLEVDKVRPYALTPGFGAGNVSAVRDAVLEARAGSTGTPALLYVTHSIPTAMDATSGPGDGEGHLYSRQHLWVAEAVTEQVADELGLPDLHGELVFCSRSGPPQQPWLEPDVMLDLMGVQQAVWEALQQVPRKSRQALILRYFGSLSYSEMAQALGCSVSTAKSRVVYGHQALARLLEHEARVEIGYHGYHIGDVP